MCGIFGFITHSSAGPEIARLRRLALITQTRGAHAFGLAWLDGDGALYTLKRALEARLCLDELERCRGARIVVGHCRYATHGDPEDNRNNHPHACGAGWLVHNGVVLNHAELARRYRLRPRSECDSEVLAHLPARLPGAARRVAGTQSMSGTSRRAGLG